MKQNTFTGTFPLVAVLMLLTIWPSHAEAKKIKYSEQIVYSGKVDSNGQPYGEGTLTTTYGEYKDILEGTFENGVVREATLRLKVYDKKYEYFAFSGTLGYTVSEDGKSVCYNLTEGSFTQNIYSKDNFDYKSEYPEVSSEETFTIKSDAPLSIVSTPSPIINNFEIGVVKKTYNIQSKRVDSSAINETLKLVGANNFGNITTLTRIVSFEFDDNNRFKLYPQPDAALEVGYANGAIVSATATKANCKYANGDSCYVNKKSNECSFHKTFSDGSVLTKDTSSAIVRYNGKDKNGATSLTDIEDVSAFMGCTSIDCATELYYFYFDPYYDIAIKGLNGDANAQFQLGKALMEGDGLEKNETLGTKWLTNAVKSGNEAAKEYCKASNIRIIINTELIEAAVGIIAMQNGGNKYAITYLNGDKVIKDRETLYDGTIYHMDNGLLEVKNGQMHFTRNDSIYFVGFFKEQVHDGYFTMTNDPQLLSFNELTPWYGTVTYPNGEVEEITEGIKPKAVPVGSVKEIDDALALTKGTRYIDEDYKITLPLHIIGDTKTHESFPLGDIKATVTIEVINFGQDGNTILQTWNFDSPEIPNQTISWSGKSVHLMPCYDNGIGSFAILRGSTICGQVSCMRQNDGKILWAGITNSVEEAITMREFHKGMSISEVEDIWTQLRFCQFKFSTNSRQYKVYSAYWLDMQKRYNLFGDYKYVMRNDKKYADYFFDSQGKLVKWILYI